MKDKQRRMLGTGFFLAIIFAMLEAVDARAVDLSIAYAQSSELSIIVSYFDRSTEGNSLVGTLQIENISNTWVYVEQDRTYPPSATAIPVTLPYTVYLLGPGAKKTFPNFRFPEGYYLRLVATTPLGLDYNIDVQRTNALLCALTVDLMTRGLLTFSLPPTAFDETLLFLDTVVPIFTEIMSTIGNGNGQLAVGITNGSLSDIIGGISKIASEKDIKDFLKELLKKKNYATAEQVDNALERAGTLADILNLPEKLRLLTELTAGTFIAPPSTWSRLDSVVRVHSPSITTVSPSELSTQPLPQTQTLTVTGINLTPESRLVFRIGNEIYSSRPERLRHVSSTKL